jgi:hypothetical protein
MPFPDLINAVQELVAEHELNKDTPLLLAIYFRSLHHPDDECLFEVLDNFGYNQVADDQRVFQITFGRSNEFEIPQKALVRLFLTNPKELAVAKREFWSDLEDLREAIDRGSYETLYQAENDRDALSTILSSRMERV